MYIRYRNRPAVEDLNELQQRMRIWTYGVPDRAADDADDADNRFFPVISAIRGLIR